MKNRKDTVFIANVDAVLGKRGEITGSYAAKAVHVVQRFLLYHTLGGFPVDAVVLPTEPNKDFVNYLKDLFDTIPHYYVAEGIDKSDLWIADGIRPEWIRGKRVEYYISEADLYDRVRTCGGEYVGGKFDKDIIYSANDKQMYKDLNRGFVKVASGFCVNGIDRIALEVLENSVRGFDSFVRMTNSGGGLGNMKVSKEMLKVEDIKRSFLAVHPQWANARAMVEEIIDLIWSPGVTFDVSREKFLYDFLQITNNDDYIGAWLPIPEKVCDRNELIKLVPRFITSLKSVGFSGYADTDLGVDKNGDIWGFEFNARKDGVLHIYQAVSRFHGSIDNWGEGRVVVKGLDDFILNSELTFEDLRSALADMGILATRDNPWGVIISIPPNGKECGLIFVAKTYKDVHEMYSDVDQRIGGINKDDHPLF